MVVSDRRITRLSTPNSTPPHGSSLLLPEPDFPAQLPLGSSHCTCNPCKVPEDPESQHFLMAATGRLNTHLSQGIYCFVYWVGFKQLLGLILVLLESFGHIETKTLRPSLTQEPVIKEFYALHNKTSANVSKLIAMHSSILIFQSFQSPEYFLSQVSCHLWMLLTRNPYKPHLQDFASDVSGYLPLHNCMSGDEIIYILPIQHLLRNNGPQKNTP